MFHPEISSSRLKALRKAKGVLQEDVAATIHVSTKTYADFERGERQISYNSLVALSDYFNVSIDYLLGVSDFANIYNEKLSNDTGLSDAALNNIRKMSAEELLILNSILEGGNITDDYVNYISHLQIIVDNFFKQLGKPITVGNTELDGVYKDKMYSQINSEYLLKLFDNLCAKKDIYNHFMRKFAILDISSFWDSNIQTHQGDDKFVKNCEKQKKKAIKEAKNTDYYANVNNRKE